MIGRRLALALLSLCSAGVLAQDVPTLTVTANSCIADINRGLITDGSFALLATDMSDGAVPVGGGGLQMMAEAVTHPITNGSITPFTISNPVLSSPSAVFRITITNNVSRKITTYRKVGIKVASGVSTWDFCAFQTGNVTPTIAANYILGPVGPQGPPGPPGSGTGSGGIASLTGDGTASGTGAAVFTLSPFGSAGTYMKVTTDAKGRVSSGSTSLAAGDIPASLTSSTTGNAGTATAAAALGSHCTGTNSVATGVDAHWNAICTTVTAGAAAPAGTAQYQFQVRDALGNVTGYSTASADNIGNVAARSLNSISDATFNNTSGITSGDGANGISNSLAVPGAVVSTGPSYSSVNEANLNNGRGLAGYAGIYRGSFPYAANTTLIDYRAAMKGLFFFNTPAGSSIWNIQNYINSMPQSAGSGGRNVLQQIQQVSTYGGKDIDPITGSGGDEFVALQVEEESSTGGIKGGIKAAVATAGHGDVHTLEAITYADGGCPESAAECGTVIRGGLIQDDHDMAGTLDGSPGTGSTQVHANWSQTIQAGPGDGKALLRTTGGGTLYHITRTTDPSGSDPGTFTVSETLTPVAYGRINGANHVPGIYRGFQTTATTIDVILQNGTAFTAGQACTGDNFGEPAENFTISSVEAVGLYEAGKQRLHVNLRFPRWTVNAPVFQSPLGCSFMAIDANQAVSSSAAPLRDVVRILGVIDAHTFAYAKLYAGGWQAQPNGYFSTAAGSNTAHLFLGASVASHVNPTTGSDDGTMILEPNQVPWIAGDSVELQEADAENNGNVVLMNVQTNSPNDASHPFNEINFHHTGTFFPRSYKTINIDTGVSPSRYVGMGGNAPVDAVLLNYHSIQYANLFATDTPPSAAGGGLINITGCPGIQSDGTYVANHAAGCATAGNAYPLMTLAGNGAVYAQTQSPFNTTFCQFVKRSSDGVNTPLCVFPDGVSVGGSFRATRIFVNENAAFDYGGHGASSIALFQVPSVGGPVGSLTADLTVRQLTISGDGLGDINFVAPAGGAATFGGQPTMFIHRASEGYFSFDTSTLGTGTTRTQGGANVEANNVTAHGAVTATQFNGIAFLHAATAPTGGCTAVSWTLSDDGHGTFCNGTTYVSKF